MLKDNHLLNMGLIFMVVNIVDGDKKIEENDDIANHLKQNIKPKLNLKFFGGPCTGEVQ